jgi:hypothetical protein
MDEEKAGSCLCGFHKARCPLPTPSVLQEPAAWFIKPSVGLPTAFRRFCAQQS